MHTEHDESKDMLSHYQMNRGNVVLKDRANKNIKSLLLQNPYIFDDLQLCFVKLNNCKKELSEEEYTKRMIQIIFTYVYLLI